MTLAQLLARCTPTTNGCLLWNGASCHGYGRVKLAGRTWGAHRLAYVLANGPIPAGMLVGHTCDMRACIAPKHLHLATHATNAADAKAKNRYHRREACGQGHPFDEANAYVRPDGRGRICRRCMVRWVTAYRQRQRAAA